MKRNSKFELLRIISMGMILLSHYRLYSGNTSEKLRILDPLGQIGVGMFVMISAFFLVEEKNAESKLLRRILSLWSRVLFYSWLILIIDLFLNFSSINKKTLVKSVFPIIGNNYWFVTSFIVLMFIVPVLNRIINYMNKKQFLLGLIVIIIFSSVTTLIGQPYTPFGQPLNVGVMISEYMLVGYYKKYNIRLNRYILLIVIVSFYIGELLLGISNGAPSIILSAAIFIMFIQVLPDMYNVYINWIASSIFASYLITEHVLFRIPFWKLTTSILNFNNKLIEGLIITIITIISTVFIDKVYLLIFNKLIRNKSNLLAKKIDLKLDLE